MSASVLVIDDEPMFQDLTRSVLCIAQHRVEIASNGFEALKLLGRSEFDVVIVDYHLPEMDGYALARLLIEHTRYRQRRPVLVAVTADPDGLAVRRGSDSIFACILPKPVAPRQLLLVIELALRQEQGVGELGPAATALVANPDTRTAVEASRAFWREAGLPDRPRALVLPSPTRDQSAALTICFDLCEEVENADLLITTEPSAFAELGARLGPAASRLPVIGVNRIEAPVLDLEFKLSDRASWRRLASIVHAFAERRRRIVATVAASDAAEDRLLCAIFVHGRNWRDGSDLLWPAGEAGQDAPRVAEALLAAGLLQRPAVEGNGFEISPAGFHRVTGQAGFDDRPEAAAEPAGRPLASVKIVVPAADTTSSSGGSGTGILVLEPDDFTRDVMASVLEEAGHRVVFASSGEDVARDREGDPCGIAVLPVEQWPPVGQAAAALASAGAGGKAVIAVVPASDTSVAAILASGLVQEVLARPLKPRALLDAVTRLLAEQSLGIASFDETVFADLTDMVGESGSTRLVMKMSAQLRQRFTAPSDPAAGSEGLRADAHAIKGSAGMLGLSRLSALCGRLEKACDAGHGVATALAQVLAARDHALIHLETLGARGADTPIAAA